MFAALMMLAFAGTASAKPGCITVGGHEQCHAQASQELAQSETPEASAPVAEEPRIAVAQNSITGGLRAAKKGDNSWDVMTGAQYAKYVNEHPGQTSESWNDIKYENVNGCSNTGGWIRRTIDIRTRVVALTGRYDDIDNRLVELGRGQNRASWFRRGTEVVGTTGLCILSGGWYCGAAIASGLNNEAQGMSYDKAMKLNRDATHLNNDAGRLYVEMAALNMDENMGWIEEFAVFCRVQHPDAFIGPAAARPAGHTYHDRG
jgi:hypothetical protein